MDFTITKFALERIRDDLRGYYNDMEWSKSEIARGCFSIQEEANRLQRAVMRIEAVKQVLYDMRIRYEWDGENVKLFNAVTDEHIA